MRQNQIAKFILVLVCAAAFGGASAALAASDTSCFGGGTGGAAEDVTVAGTSAFACGFHASAVGDNSTAVGTNSAATANGTAIGNGAQANANNSVAVGNGSVASDVNTFSVGNSGNERRVVNVATGISPTDAVNVAQLQGATANLQSQIQNMSASFQSRFDAINNDIQNVNMEARRGIAAVAAITNTPMPSAPGKTSWAVNTSAFRGEFGTGFSLAHRLRTAVPLAVTVAYGNGGGRENIVRMGLMGEF